MGSLLTIGECMMELKAADHESYSKAFAGDTYNSAVYAKRFSPDLKVSFLSAVGEDPISEEMLDKCSLEGVDTGQILRSESLLPGIYVITTDEHGERSFSYWRKSSAASKMMPLLEQQGGHGKVPDYDYVFFSGISLSILNDGDKAELLSLLATLKERGARIAFDPNYRPKMWRDLQHAVFWIEKAYRLSDIVFPGLEDHEQLFSHSDQSEIKAYLQALGTTEIVIKSGDLGVYGYCPDEEDAHESFCPVSNQVDSTAAGDSFAGTYLASRLSGESMANSIKAADRVAAFVVQHKGAIVDNADYSEFIDLQRATNYCR